VNADFVPAGFDGGPQGAVIAVVADDLIWASRIVAAVQQAGGTPIRIGSDEDLAIALETNALEEPEPDDPDGARRIIAAVVDLFGHHYDGVEAVRAIRAAGLPVIAVAQHDDQETRGLALDAGAMRVFSYNKFFQDGPALVRRWLTEPTEGE
jgi:DNA-binding response OmpR family regulator